MPTKPTPGTLGGAYNTLPALVGIAAVALALAFYFGA